MSAQPKRALIVIDVQNEYFTGKLRIEHPPTDVSLPNIARAMDAARAAGIPVVVVQHSTPEGAPIFARGGESWQLHPEIARRGHDHRIEKSLASAFAGTRLAEWLQEKGIDTLTIAGYMSHNCDVSTALEAYHRGMTVEFLSDGTGSLPYANDAGRASAEEIHRVISVVLHANFAAVVPTDAWIAAVKDGAVLRKDNIIASNQRGAAAA